MELQENLENESRDKSTLLAKMRDLQASYNQAQESLEEEPVAQAAQASAPQAQAPAGHLHYRADGHEVRS